jgi:hypothetical protein
MLKDKSVFKTSTGDEAGSAPKKGVVTSKIKGKVFALGIPNSRQDTCPS